MVQLLRNGKQIQKIGKMLKNYLKTAIRNFLRQKAFSFINVLGLAIGMSSAIFIFIWVHDELSYDKFLDNYDHLALVVEEQNYQGGEKFSVPVTPGPLAQALEEEIPEIKNAVRFQRTYMKVMLKKDEKIFNEKYISVADSDFFDLFSFTFLHGNPETALDKPNSIVMIKDKAIKYFGTENAVGKTITLDNQKEFTVTGVIDNYPDNSNFNFEFLVPFSFLNDLWDVDLSTWSNNSIMTLVLLKPNANIQAVNNKIKDFFDTHKEEESIIDIYLHPWKKMHLYNIENDSGLIIYVRIFIVVGIFVLLIACINFMNLTTARSMRRAREVGIRKVTGAHKKQLITQFFAESFFLTIISMILAIGLTELFLPTFRDISAKELTIEYTSPVFIFGIIGITLITGIISGSYPAFYLSRFKPALVIKSKMPKDKKSELFRKTLVIFQFTLSILLISSTLLIYKQIHYIQHKNLGFNKENLLFLEVNDDFKNRYETLRSSLANNPNVMNISATRNIPNQIGNSTWNVSWPGKDPDTKMLFHNLFTDFGIIETMDYNIIKGRAFSDEYATDSSAVIVNQKAKKRMGIDNIVGKNIQLWEDTFNVIGVVEDFNFKHFSNQIEPLIILPALDYCKYIAIRINSKNIQKTIADIEDKWYDISPKFPFEYTFFDQEFDEMYRTESRIGKLFNIFTVLAIFISALGLFGLASFMIEQRRKEISIRKVLGAKTTTIWLLLTTQFIKWVAIAFILATPLAYYSMHKWLQDFVYHTDISWWIFAIAGFTAIIIAVLTVSFQAIKAANANPANTLKYE